MNLPRTREQLEQFQLIFARNDFRKYCEDSNADDAEVAEWIEFVEQNFPCMVERIDKQVYVARVRVR